MNNLFSAATCIGSMGAKSVSTAYNLSPQGYSLLANKTNEIISSAGKLKVPKLATTLSREILSRGTKSQCDNDAECSQLQTNIENSIKSVIENSPNKIYNYDPNSSEWQNIVADHYKTVIDDSYDKRTKIHIKILEKILANTETNLNLLIESKESKECFKIKNKLRSSRWHYNKRNECIINKNKEIQTLLTNINNYKTAIKKLEDQTFDDYCNS